MQMLQGWQDGTGRLLCFFAGCGCAAQLMQKIDQRLRVLLQLCVRATAAQRLAEGVRPARNFRRMQSSLGKAQCADAEPGVNPVRLHKQHAVRPGLQGLGVAGMPVAGLDHYYAACRQSFGAVVVQKQCLSLIYQAYGILRMGMQAVAVAGLLTDAQLGPGRSGMAVKLVAGSGHGRVIMPAC